MKQEQTLEQLFRADFNRLVFALSALAGDRNVAADAVQDAFVQAHLHWPRVCSLADPAGWVRRVAVNRIFNHQRKMRRRGLALARLAGEPIPVVDVGVEDSGLAAAIRALPDRQRTAVCLYYLADLSVNEVAVAMGVSPGATKSHLHRARARLAELLELRNEP